MMTEPAGLPDGLYSLNPLQRVVALGKVTEAQREHLLAGISWPIKSPGTLNAWLVFLGASPGNSPGTAQWDYDPRPTIGGAHPGLAEYRDTNGYWDAIRKFARWIFPELSPSGAYASTMVRNLDPSESATAPQGRQMHEAAQVALSDLNHAIRPVMIVALGGVRTYSDQAFARHPGAKLDDSGTLFTASSRKARPWKALRSRWSDGTPFLYVSASGIHPSLPHVSEPDTHAFLVRQAERARALGD